MAATKTMTMDGLSTDDIVSLAATIRGYLTDEKLD